MTAQQREDWRLVREVFEAALAHPTERRRAFVAESCRSEPAIYDQVVALLASHDRRERLSRDLGRDPAGVPARGHRVGRWSGPERREGDRSLLHRVAHRARRHGLGLPGATGRPRVRAAGGHQDDPPRHGLRRCSSGASATSGRSSPRSITRTSPASSTAAPPRRACPTSSWSTWTACRSTATPTSTG